MGGRGLAAVFRALCVNFRHFSGGLPDLLLLRAASRPRRTAATAAAAAPSPGCGGLVGGGDQGGEPGTPVKSESLLAIQRVVATPTEVAAKGEVGEHGEEEEWTEMDFDQVVAELGSGRQRGGRRPANITGKSETRRLQRASDNATSAECPPESTAKLKSLAAPLDSDSEGTDSSPRAGAGTGTAQLEAGKTTGPDPAAGLNLVPHARQSSLGPSGSLLKLDWKNTEYRFECRLVEVGFVPPPARSPLLVKFWSNADSNAGSLWSIPFHPCVSG